MVSFFEMAIKQKLNKLSLSKSLSDFYYTTLDHGIDILPVKEQHIFNYQAIPLIDTHRDPFDRLLIATALFESSTIISIDDQFNNYKDLINIAW